MVLDRAQPDDQKLMKKGKGRLIHVLDFVEEENGRLIICNESGNMVKDARCITYPGAQGDAWWDQPQLLTQVDKALSIFEEAHPECVALFVFDQSSAHASLAPDALCAFDMNKGNGGKQRKQRDTMIPMNNPCTEFCGMPQKMTMETGDAKGLLQTLEERGFKVNKKMKAKCSPVCTFKNEGCCMARLLSKQDDFRLQKSLLEETITGRGHLCTFLPKFHCELNPIEMVCSYFILLLSNSQHVQYWGWCKQQYRQIYKDKFDDAKRLTRECLDACPVNVIQRFFNRSWRFMSAYHQGLTGKAAEWAMRKQKSHRRAGEQAMDSIEAIDTTN